MNGRARLAMQEGEVSARTETRRGHRVARRLFQDQDQDQDQDRYHNRDRNNDEGSGSPRSYTGAEDNLTNRLSEEARQDLAKAKEKWNFDFENDRPLPGRWDWRKVQNGSLNDDKTRENSSKNEEDGEEDDDDDDDEKIDQREKSETEANEKADQGKKD